MKKTIVTLLLCLTLLSGARSQCTTLVEMVLGVENCLYPYIISTQHNCCLARLQKVFISWLPVIML